MATETTVVPLPPLTDQQAMSTDSPTGAKAQASGGRDAAEGTPPTPAGKGRLPARVAFVGRAGWAHHHGMAL